MGARQGGREGVGRLQCELSVDALTSLHAATALAACRLVDEIVWVKMTVNRRLAKSHGYYLQVVD